MSIDCTSDCTQTVQLNEMRRRILFLAACGYTNERIGEVVHIAPSTVKVYLAEIRACLGAQSRIEAVVAALLLGMIDGDGVAADLLPRMRRVAAANREIV
jgi:DNA-binding NarL/FixJ family response regulator